MFHFWMCFVKGIIQGVDRSFWFISWNVWSAWWHNIVVFVVFVFPHEMGLENPDWIFKYWSMGKESLLSVMPFQSPIVSESTISTYLQ